MNPDHAEALNNLAGIYLESGKKQEAIYLLQEAVRANPNFIGAKMNLEKYGR